MHHTSVEVNSCQRAMCTRGRRCLRRSQSSLTRPPVRKWKRSLEMPPKPSSGGPQKAQPKVLTECSPCCHASSWAVLSCTRLSTWCHFPACPGQIWPSGARIMRALSIRSREALSSATGSVEARMPMSANSALPAGRSAIAVRCHILHEVDETDSLLESTRHRRRSMGQIYLEALLVLSLPGKGLRLQTKGRCCSRCTSLNRAAACRLASTGHQPDTPSGNARIHRTWSHPAGPAHPVLIPSWTA